MDERKSLLTHLSEAFDRYRAERRTVVPQQATVERRGWPQWLGRQMIPNIGTLLLVAVLLVTVPSLAAPRCALEATSTSTISYQGRLADSAGNPLTGYYNLEFRIYDVPDGGVPLWEEFWTGGNSVQVSDGLFNVMLGSINNTLASAIEGHDELYLGITVGTDSEMAPRVQLGSVPFSMQAMTVPDGSITTPKLADGAVTSEKLGAGVLPVLKGDGGNTGITTEWTDLASQSITLDHIANVLIVADSRAIDAVEGDWLDFKITRNGDLVHSNWHQRIGITGWYQYINFVTVDENVPPGTYEYRFTGHLANGSGGRTVYSPYIVLIPFPAGE